MRPRTPHSASPAFSRLDLLALLATAALLALVATAMASTHRVTPEVILCQENLRRLAKGWHAHGTDNTLLARNPVGPEATVPNPLTPDSWALGWLDWTTTPDNTNLSRIQVPAFVPYVGTDTGIFRCPSDRYITPVQRSRGWQYRVRTYAMNSLVHSTAAEIFASGYARFRTLSDFSSPQTTFVFTEEHPDSMSDPNFLAAERGSRFVDIPASFHDGGANFAFADGHVETRRWLNARIRQPVRGTAFNPVTVLSSDPDLLWLSERTTQIVR
jgi:prepilin-type processing-associated H-X9-DG protein